jgi:hypothetical protein
MLIFGKFLVLMNTQFQSYNFYLFFINSKSFFIDFLFCLVPLVLVCTVLSSWKFFSQVTLMVLILWLHKFVNSYSQELKFPLTHFMPTNFGLGKDEYGLLSFDSVEEEVLRYLFENIKKSLLI